MTTTALSILKRTPHEQRKRCRHAPLDPLLGLHFRRVLGDAVASPYRWPVGPVRAAQGRLRRTDGQTKVIFGLAYESAGNLLGLIADRVAARQVGRNMSETPKNLQQDAEEPATDGRTPSRPASEESPHLAHPRSAPPGSG